MIDNISSILQNILQISQSIRFKGKKRKIIFSLFLSNGVVVLDIAIIYLLTSYFQKVDLPEFMMFINIEKLNYLLPVFVIFRYLVLYLEVMNLHNLRLGIEKSLRENFLREVFLRGNYSVSDSYFFINTLSVHVSTFYQNFTSLLTNFIKILLFFAFLLFSEPSNFTFFILGLLFLIFPSRYFSILNRRYSHISYESSNSISKNIERVIDNLYLIKILNKFKDEMKNYISNLDTYYDSQIKNQKYGTLNSIFPSFLTLLFLSVILLIYPTGSIITLEFIAIILRLFQSLGDFNKVFSMSISTYVHLEKVLLIINNQKEVFSKNFSIVETQTENIIEIKNIDFKYLNSDKLIFQNLSLNIEKGKHTIVTGPNGIGKSTFLGIVSGVFYPERGSVKLGTTKIGYVSAYPMILNTTLKDNLTYGVSEKISDKKLIEHINQFQLFKENDYDLNLKVSNKSLSSGQMQKVSFIRALLSNPNLLILDESTANLDTETSSFLYQLIEGLNITILNSTHSSDQFSNYDTEFKFKIENGNTKIQVIK